MAKEIERKYLVNNDSYKYCYESKVEIAQGYLSDNADATVRVRTVDSKGFLTVKSRNKGATRDEWEYEVPFRDAADMLNLCNESTIIRKTRYRCDRWEIDEFKGRHSGLVLAEIELTSEDETFSIPSFIGKEVTGDTRYYNSVIASGGIPESMP